MLDIRMFREQPERIREAMVKRGSDGTEVEHVRELDELVRSLKTEAEKLQADLNIATKQMGQMMKSSAQKSAMESDWSYAS